MPSAVTSPVYRVNRNGSGLASAPLRSPGSRSSTARRRSSMPAHLGNISASGTAAVPLSSIGGTCGGTCFLPRCRRPLARAAVLAAFTAPAGSSGTLGAVHRATATTSWCCQYKMVSIACSMRCVPSLKSCVVSWHSASCTSARASAGPVSAPADGTFLCSSARASTRVSVRVARARRFSVSLVHTWDAALLVAPFSVDIFPLPLVGILLPLCAALMLPVAFVKHAASLVVSQLLHDGAAFAAALICFLIHPSAPAAEVCTPVTSIIAVAKRVNRQSAPLQFCKAASANTQPASAVPVSPTMPRDALRVSFCPPAADATTSPAACPATARYCMTFLGADATGAWLVASASHLGSGPPACDADLAHCSVPLGAAR